MFAFFFGSYYIDFPYKIKAVNYLYSPYEYYEKDSLIFTDIQLPDNIAVYILKGPLSYKMWI